MTPQDACGDYPAASGFADKYVDANGATIISPLTPAQNAAYLAAVANYQQCLAKAQGVPPCPLGEYFSGNLTNGVWVGNCISTYTGQPTTPTVTVPVADVPTMPPITAPAAPAAPAPVTTTPATPAAPPAPATTPPAPQSKTPAPRDSFSGTGDTDFQNYCELYPEDPICYFWSGPGGVYPFPTQAGGSTTEDILYVTEGLTATDVGGIVDSALSGLWAAVVGAVDAVIADAIGALQNVITDLGNALKAAYAILARLAGYILNFLKQMYNAIVKAMVWALQEIRLLLTDLYQDLLAPILRGVLNLKKYLMDIYQRFLRPMLLVLQDIRRVLAILAAFHIGWAQKLDAKLADLERRITQPFLYLLGFVNQVANWINLIVTAGYLLQKPLFMNSLQAYVGDAINLQLNAMNQPPSSAAIAAAAAAGSTPPAAQSVADFNAFVTIDSGPLPDLIKGYSSEFDTYLSQGV
jgi:hypothetical protein